MNETVTFSTVDAASATVLLMTTRQNTLPRRLLAPGPSEAQIHTLFLAAASAPDHGRVVPWRFVLVPDQRRPALAQAFAQALMDRDENATASQLAQAREKAFRSPFLALVVARLGPCEPYVDPVERMVSVGAAVQNMLLTAHSMGFGCGLTSGQAMLSSSLGSLFKLTLDERAVCFVNVGTVTQAKPPRPHPNVASFVSTL